MIGYIYHIKCETTGKEYIGITEDVRRRSIIIVQTYA